MSEKYFTPAVSGMAIIAGGFALATVILLFFTTGLSGYLKAQPQPTFNASAICLNETYSAYLDCIANPKVNEGDPDLPEEVIKECEERYAKTCTKCRKAFGDPVPKGAFGEIGCRNLVKKVADDQVAGDANGDGAFNSQDLVQVFQAGLYESSTAADFEEGNWDGQWPWVFDSSDFVHVFQAGTYQGGAAALQADWNEIGQ